MKVLQLMRGLPRTIRWVLVLGCLTIIGCGGNEIDATTILSAQQSYDQGLTQYEAGDYAAAKTSLDAAIENPAGLDADAYADVLLRRAICSAIAGNLEEAEKDIAQAEQGATAMELVYVAKGVVATKKGDAAGGQSFFKQAKQINPKIVIPTE
jgi:tetratricopeptide (TPR) repeat protein